MNEGLSDDKINKNRRTLNISIGDHFGEWEILSKYDKSRYTCRCSCGSIKNISGTDLTRGKSTSCGHKRKKYKVNIGDKYNDWTVLSFDKNKYLYECRCTCGNISMISASDLVNGKSKSCGHNRNRLIDLTGRRFGEWTVLRHIGYGVWECQCSCENHTIRNIRHTELLNGDSKSCGCKQAENLMKTMLDRYGEIASPKINKPRTIEQIQAASSKENIEIEIRTFNYKPTIYELANKLGLSYSATIKLIHEYNLEELVKIYEDGWSRYEYEIYEYIKGLGQNLNIVTHARNIIQGELDLYIPDYRLAIEFNGNYWHSSIFKNKDYHQNKRIQCAKQGIRLISIFEYEWTDIIKNNIIKWILKNAILKENFIYARKCKIKHINNIEEKQFLEQNHLNGYVPSHIAYGCYLNSELIGVMSWGIPRYSKDYDYELIRLSWKTGYNILGGSEKLFKKFIDEHPDVNKIIAYCDISKFSGNVYGRLGFSTSINSITPPNYIWIRLSDLDIKTRYQAMKHKLVERGLGTLEQTEKEIMGSLGYVQIFDCGNLKFIWTKQI